VQAQRERLNDGIASQLRARRPLWQARGRPGGGGDRSQGPRGRRR
jgi:ATP-dependent RNA helicase SUPV3L1/SUV3